MDSEKKKEKKEKAEEEKKERKERKKEKEEYEKVKPQKEASEKKDKKAKEKDKEVEKEKEKEDDDSKEAAEKKEKEKKKKEKEKEKGKEKDKDKEKGKEKDRESRDSEKKDEEAYDEDDPEKRREKEEKRKEKEERKKLKEEMLAREKEIKKKQKEEKEEEKKKEKEEKQKEKEDKKAMDNKRAQMRERRKSWLKQSQNPDAVNMEVEKPAVDEGKRRSWEPDQKKVAADLVRRQREWEQFLLNMPLKKLRGTTWKYYDIAPEDGYSEALVLLHGGGIRPEAMFEYIIGFAQYYRVIAPWIPEELNELEDVVAGLILVMRHEGVKRAHFAGMSFGGIVAHHFLYRHPNRALTVTLIHAQAPDEKFERICRKWMKNQDAKPPPALQRMLTGYGIKAKDLESHIIDLSKGEKELWTSILKKCTARRQAVASYVDAMMDLHGKQAYTKKDFKGWQGRMLLIESEDDELFDSHNFKMLHDMHPGTAIHYFQGSGSLLALVRCEKVVDVILKFIWDEESENSNSELSQSQDKVTTSSLARPVGASTKKKEDEKANEAAPE